MCWLFLRERDDQRQCPGFGLLFTSPDLFSDMTFYIMHNDSSDFKSVKSFGNGDSSVSFRIV